MVGPTVDGLTRAPTPGTSADPGRRLRLCALVSLGALALLVLLVGLVQARDDSPTFDGPVYVSAGLLTLTQHDLAYNAEHPPLAKAAAALPVLLTPYVLPAGHTAEANDEKTYAATFLRAQRDALAAVTFASRIMPLAELLGVAALLLLLGRALVGLGGGVVASGLWLVSPMTLGLGHLDGVDVPFALAVCTYALALLHLRRRGDRRAVLLLGGALGLCLATSALGLVLGPLTVILLFGQRRRRAARRAIAVVAVAWAVLWASYLVFDPGVIAHPRFLLPAPYVDGLGYLATQDTGPSAGYLLGQSWLGGQWWFWPGSLLVKLTTPVLLLLLLGPWCWRLAEPARRRDALVVLAAPAVVLTVPVLASSRDLGARYLLPVVALWCAGAAPAALFGHRAWARALGVVAALAAGLMLVASLPHSLAYTSPPFRPGYRVASDSNLDWGQDLNLLQRWAVGRHPYVAWFGPRGTSWSDVPSARDLLATPVAQVRGWVAVSATALTGDGAGALSWLRRYCPVATLGGTVLLYDFTVAPTPGPGPEAPAPPCAGEVSVATG